MKISCCFSGPEVLRSEIATKLCGSANFVFKDVGERVLAVITPDGRTSGLKET